MVHVNERDFPAGHPSSPDYNPQSAEAREWARLNVHPLGERDFPVDHPKAADTPGNLNRTVWRAGVDPLNPHLEEFTGRTPEQAAAVRELSVLASKAAIESPALEPVDAGVVNAALATKRKELGVDSLTEAQVREVLASFAE
ncbi:MAG TPA: hypothetical protein VKB60_00060 [Terriglobales bacterium]|nr:hypothetical protein [Terriglobales bacterium]